MDLHNVRQYLGLASYFRKFIKNFAFIAKPLTNLTKKNVVFVWGNAEQTAFEILKDKLISKPALAIYDGNAETEVHTDASKMGIGATLIQMHNRGELQPA